jgi:hypothetical protein
VRDSELDRASLEDVLAAAQDIAAQPDVLFQPSPWVSNGTRGTLHASAGNLRGECHSFFARDSILDWEMSLREAVSHSQQHCARCTSLRARELAAGDDQVLRDALVTAVRVRELVRVAQKPATPTGREQYRATAGRLLLEMDRLERKTLPARTSRWLESARTAVSTTDMSLAAANTADFAGVHDDAVETLLSALTRDMVLHDLHLATFGGVTTRRDLLNVFQEWRTRLTADLGTRRQEAIDALVGELQSVEQLAHVDPAEIAAEMTSTQASPVAARLHAAWHRYAVKTAATLVDRWEEQWQEWTAGTTRETVLLALPAAHPAGLAVAARAAGTSCTMPAPYGGSLDVVSVTETTRRALELSAWTAGAPNPLGVYVHRVPDGVPSVIAQTALGVWTPWDAGSPLADPDAALEAARLLMKDQAPARTVRVSAPASQALEAAGSRGRLVVR